MSEELKNKLNSIPLSSSIDRKVNMGFNEARKELSKKKNKFRNIAIGIAASAAIIFLSVSIIGTDRVEAVIKQMLQYIPGFNITVDTSKGEVYTLLEPVSIKKDDIYINLLAATKSDKNIHLMVESNYKLSNHDKETAKNNLDDMVVKLVDQHGKKYNPKGYGRGAGGQFWSGEYYFEIDKEGNSFILLVDELEIPFTLKEAATVEDFKELGPYAENKGITIVGIKKQVDDKIKISLLSRSTQGEIADYAYGDGTYTGYFELPDVPESMHLIDKEGNKILPTLPSSTHDLMSDFYFEALDKPELKLVIPYVKVIYPNEKSDKLKITVPQDGERIELNKVLKLGKFDINVKDVERKADQVLIRLGGNGLDDEMLTGFSVGGHFGYGMVPYGDTELYELSIDVKDIQKDFNLFFENPTSILTGNWEILFK